MQTPHKRSFAAEELARRQKKRPMIWIVAAVVGMTLLIGGYALYRMTVSQQTVVTETSHIKSIAVLPFMDLSPEKTQEHLGDGIAEMIIGALSNVQSLRVVASTSSFRFKGREKAISEVGKDLDVEWVLEGSVNKEADRIRVIAQLIRVEDESHIWSRTYNYPFKSVLAIQDSISLAVLNELKFTLMGEEKAAVVRRYTNDPDAYDLYLQGISQFKRGMNQDNLETGLHFLHRAVEKDPEFALAFAGLAIGYYFTDRDKMKPAIQKALELDDSLPEVQLAAGYIAMFYDWDFPAAEQDLRKALTMNPGFVSARTEYAAYLRAMGRYEEALVELKRARDDDPLTAAHYVETMWLNVSLNQYDEAIENYRKASEIDPENIVLGQIAYMRILNKQGKYQEALDFFETEEITDSWNLMKVYMLALSGNTIEARELFDSTLKNYEVSDEISQQLNNTWAAIACTGLGDYDRALDYLEKAYEEREMVLIFIKDNYEFDPLRSDPRFSDLMKKIGLPED